jgi:hypothetical protein
MENERRFEIRGKQAVTVDDRYAYLWGGDTPLAVGDRVVLGGSAFSSDWVGTVTALGSTYDGHHSYILDRLEKP